MADTRWKAFERRCAQLLGTQRIPVTGERNGADAETPLFAIQFKKRACVPGYLRDWLTGIRAAAAARRKIGIVVMQNPGGQDLDSFVVVSLRDWLDLHGPIHPAQERERIITEIAERSARDERARRPVEPEAAVHARESGAAASTGRQP